VTVATEIAAQVRTGRLRASDVVASALEIAEASHADLNAFTLIDPSGAMHRARAIDALVAGGIDPGPLAGVPLALKDIIDDAGMPNSRGGSFPRAPSAQSAEVVRRLGSAGGVIIGRTGLHEFAFGFTSENPWFGPVRNPWDPSMSPGGSSGGSGAAVAAGVVPIAIGTDTGGSVRVPAALCGVFGLKVTHGRIPLTGVFPLAGSLDTVGPLARSVDDLAVAYLAMAGDHYSDPWSQPRSVTRPSVVDADGLRLGIVRQWMTDPMSATVRSGFAQFVSLAEAVGVTFEDVDEPSLAPIPALTAAIGPEVIEVHGDRYRTHPERFGADVATRIEAAFAGTGLDVVVAERWGSAARATVARLTGSGIDALVCPTVGAPSKVIGVDTITVDGTEIPHRNVLARFTAPINRMRVPAIVGPIFGTPLPGISVQIVGEMWSEARLLAIARALEGHDVLQVREPPIYFGQTNG
jgi:aspartyl-tRNA(Asn)/glutamyl-tRNA(Gln) amidotransferase subunit A